MIKHKLIRILQTFSKKELSDFKNLVHSPYFNKNQQVKDLIDVLHKYPQLASPHVDKKVLIKKVLKSKQPNKKDEQTLQNLFTKLTKLCYTFLTNEALKDKPIDKNIHILSTYKDRQAIIDALYSPTQNLLNKMDKGNIQYYRYKYELGTLRMFWTDLFEKKKMPSNEIKTINDNFDTYYVFTKVLNLYEIVNASLISEDPLPISKAKTEALAVYLQNTWKDNVLIQKFVQTLLMLLNMNEEHSEFYDELKLFLEREAYDHPQALVLELIKAIMNYCTVKNLRYYDPDKSMDYEKDFLIFFDLELDILEQMGIQSLPANLFANYVGTAVGANETAKGYAFIEKHKSKLAPDQREESYLLAKATLLFHESRVNEAHALVKDLSPQIGILKILLRSLMLKIYYKQKEFLALSYTLENGRLFAMRHKAAPQAKSYLKYLNFFKRLGRITENWDTEIRSKSLEKLQKYREDLSASEIPPGSKKWFFNECDYLQKGT